MTNLQIQEILNGLDAVTKTLEQITKILTDHIQPEPNKPVNVVCPDCGGPMTSRSGQYGKFWGCNKYPTCRGTRDSMGRSKAERDAEKDQPRESKRWEVPS